MPVLKPTGWFNKTKCICLKMHGMNNFKTKALTIRFYANFHHITLNATHHIPSKPRNTAFSKGMPVYLRDAGDNNRTL
jgi:hypothetical protein